MASLAIQKVLQPTHSSPICLVKHYISFLGSPLHTGGGCTRTAAPSSNRSAPDPLQPNHTVRTYASPVCFTPAIIRKVREEYNNICFASIVLVKHIRQKILTNHCLRSCERRHSLSTTSVPWTKFRPQIRAFASVSTFGNKKN